MLGVEDWQLAIIADILIFWVLGIKELLLVESGASYHYDDFRDDYSIQIHSQSCIMSRYHKVDDFNFDLINFPFPDSNIHSRITYSIIHFTLYLFNSLGYVIMVITLHGVYMACELSVVES